MRRGDSVLCNFPFRGSSGPGPTPHIVLVAWTASIGAQPVALVYYTTTVIQFAGQARPRQYILVDEIQARSLGQQRAFHIDATRLALLPVTEAYFPELVAGAVRPRGSDPQVVAAVERRVAQLRDSGIPIIPVRGA